MSQANPKSNAKVINIRSSKLLQKRAQEVLNRFPKAPIKPPLATNKLSSSQLELQELRLMVMKLIEIQQEVVERVEKNEENFLKLLKYLKSSGVFEKPSEQESTPP